MRIVGKPLVLCYLDFVKGIPYFFVFGIVAYIRNSWKIAEWTHWQILVFPHYVKPGKDIDDRCES